MNILLVLIPVTLALIAIAVALFFWAVNHQQFDDLDSPGALPLMDDPPTASIADAEPDAASGSASADDVEAGEPPPAAGNPG